MYSSSFSLSFLIQVTILSGILDSFVNNYSYFYVLSSMSFLNFNSSSLSMVREVKKEAEFGFDRYYFTNSGGLMFTLPMALDRCQRKDCLISGCYMSLKLSSHFSVK